MMRTDPIQVTNRYVREFAAQHHLRTVVAEDGEVVIPCGPRRATIHLGFGLRPATWYVCAIRLTLRRAGAILDVLTAAGCRAIQCGDAEFVLDLPPDLDPLSILDRHGWTRPRRRVRQSPEAVAAATARLVALRGRSAVPGPPAEGTSGAGNRSAAVETTFRASVTAPAPRGGPAGGGAR